jgi:hypothetical protein
VGHNVPAFVFTGDTGAAGAEPGEGASGEVRILRKPLDPMRLRAYLGQALERG